MSHAEHEWVRDHLAAHAAGGLSADERARLEGHVASCGLCRGELHEVKALDRSMVGFAHPT